jgi:hypothetical protein
MNELMDWVQAAVGVFIASTFLRTHLSSSRRLKTSRTIKGEIILGTLCIALSVTFIVLFFDKKVVSLVGWAGFLYVYSVALFIFISELLLWKGAKYLTEKRGSKWVKELDYIYLGLGAIGIFGSLSRVEGLPGRSTKFDILGPVILATALVLRFIKTRAEIAEWNKPDNDNSQTFPPASTPGG